jgi:hypothetical protein
VAPVTKRIENDQDSLGDQESQDELNGLKLKSKGSVKGKGVDQYLKEVENDEI